MIFVILFKISQLESKSKENENLEETKEDAYKIPEEIRNMNFDERMDYWINEQGDKYEELNNKKYKIGIIGETMQDDFGSIMEYLGLCEYIKNSGVSYIVIPPAGKKDWCKTSVPVFTEKYNCSKKLFLIK
mgnify:CR=1 FL=1